MISYGWSYESTQLCDVNVFNAREVESGSSWDGGVAAATHRDRNVDVSHCD